MNSLFDWSTVLLIAVSVGLIWDSECPDAEHIADVLQCIGTTLKLSDVRTLYFKSVLRLPESSFPLSYLLPKLTSVCIDQENKIDGVQF